MESRRATVLCMAGTYLPGFKAGGPIRSLSNLIEQLGDEFDFKVITSDRDLHDVEPYPGITTGVWRQVGRAGVKYMSVEKLGLLGLRELLKREDFDVLYLNSFFSDTFTIKPLFLRRIRLIPAAAVVVAPRGEFSLGALSLKGFKKRVFLALAELIGLYRNVLWQASSEQEEADIRRLFGEDVPVMISPNLPTPATERSLDSHLASKTPGTLRVVFLSRISRMKNLAVALSFLSEVKGRVEFHVYGPIEDTAYWSECQAVIMKLPPNISVVYKGAVKYDEVRETLRSYDLFLLPTLGENFGHVIAEALSSGCPVLISDRTPWNNLEDQGVGWDLPLDSPELFRAALQKCVDMDLLTHKEMARRAWAFGMKRLQDTAATERARDLFRHANAVNSHD